MKSYTILMLIFLTLVSVDSDAHSNSGNNNNNNNSSSIINSSSRFTKNTFSTNFHNFNTSLVGDSSSSATFRDKRGTNFALDPSEIARQNQITQQILSNYLERRLFPHRSINQKIPTIEEILPKPTTSTVRPRPRGFAASSASYRKGAAKQQQRKTYGNGHKNRNSLFRRNKYKTTVKPDFEDDYEEVENEKNNSRKRQKNNNNSREQNIDDEFVDDAIVEDVEEEPLEEEEPETEHHHSNHHQQQRIRQQLLRHHYRYLEDSDDPEPDDRESLQSVESEQHDQYYSSNGSSGDIFARDPSENEIDSDCPNCVDEMQYMNKWTMPLLKLGEKRYYLGIFFKANWFKATQYCRYHGMHLASISSQEENDRLEKHIRDFGLGHEHFWTSGTDLADEGNFFWMSTGRPITFTNWNAGEPNNFRYENGEEENCLELWNRDGKGLKWNDSPCSFETYFVCEVQPN
ncbi:putative uncharacterized protein DDB_G0289963 [Lucilia sericata]|uniref:putative uncharacterized protein DDB_G0289963 n=1 Tax=Lucilia sericata TaxID=13632 RepID=UPI0018A83CA7|nr:putative uncharacterized protein DDB_G0289963 [Lucilia sericata]